MGAALQGVKKSTEWGMTARQAEAGFYLMIIGAMITQLIQGLRRNLAAARPR